MVRASLVWAKDFVLGVFLLLALAGSIALVVVGWTPGFGFGLGAFVVVFGVLLFALSGSAESA